MGGIVHRCLDHACGDSCDALRLLKVSSAQVAYQGKEETDRRGVLDGKPNPNPTGCTVRTRPNSTTPSPSTWLSSMTCPTGSR